ncbi:MAG TPA: hypothetical protein DCX03_07250 [Bacteroidales bacterium]|nr:hypothetical protein [Bacteroidales bacterium]
MKIKFEHWFLQRKTVKIFRNVLLFSLCFLLKPSIAQEILSNLEYNPIVAKESKTFLLKKNTQKASSLLLPFFDDFSKSEVFPNPDLWDANNVYVNQGFAYNPPNYHVVTLDALDSTGKVYSHATYTPFEADRFTSLPIRLDSIFSPAPRALLRADSIYFSFFYQPQGQGNPPQNNDSLILYFYNSRDSIWNRIWASPGMPLDTFYTHHKSWWKQVNIWISDSAQYYHDGFRFRFVNYASLANNVMPSWQSSMDHWNLDYIYLNKNRYRGDTVYRDLGFVDVSTSMLKAYNSMPYTHYSNDPVKEMNDTLYTVISNLDIVAHPSNYSYAVFDGNHQQIMSYTGGSYPVYPVYDSGYVKYKPFACPRITTILPIDPLGLKDSADLTVRHVIIGDYTPDDRLFDTLEVKQIFRNYFAYDDGTPEAGYGVTPSGSMAAVRFSLNIKDTLRAVKIYFNPTRSNANEQYFYLCVWDDNNGLPQNLLYDTIVKPDFSDEIYDFQTFVFEKPIPIRNAFYVGFITTTDDNLNIGFDRSRNSSAMNLFNIDGQWLPSQYKGSLMIRPFVGKPLSNLSREGENLKNLIIFPNPVNDNVIYLSSNLLQNGINENLTLTLFNSTGQLVFQTYLKSCLELPSSLSNGIYILQIRGKNGNIVYTSKLAVSKN